MSDIKKIDDGGHTPGKQVRICCECAVIFEPTTKKGYRCPPCRRAYDKKWRVKRKAEGLPTCGKRMPKEYQKAYEIEYFKSPEKREMRNARMRAYSKAPKTRSHHEARSKVKRAIKAGRLTRLPCEVCGATPAHAHHDDYSKPLDVRWLCSTHHWQLHAEAKKRS